jgi:hypothetical protein
LFWLNPKRVKFILPIALLGLLLWLFFFLGKYWHDRGLTPAAAYTKCHLTSTKVNTGLVVLFSSMNAKKYK